MAVLGFCMGPLNHYWYVALDRMILGRSLRVVGKKVLADQAVMAPICSSVFYIGKTNYVICSMQLEYELSVGYSS